jgi:hypothetical protein
MCNVHYYSILQYIHDVFCFLFLAKYDYFSNIALFSMITEIIKDNQYVYYCNWKSNTVNFEMIPIIITNQD